MKKLRFIKDSVCFSEIEAEFCVGQFVYFIHENTCYKDKIISLSVKIQKEEKTEIQYELASRMEHGQLYASIDEIDIIDLTQKEKKEEKEETNDLPF